MSTQSTTKTQQLSILHRDEEVTLTYDHTLPTSSPRDRERPRLLFLHGILGDRRTWQDYPQYFPEHEIIALTQWGFGKGGERDQPLDTQESAETLCAFCRALNEQENTPHRPFIIVAWSYACHVALLAALEAPTLFQQLILYELIIPSYGMDQAIHTEFTQDLTKMMSPIIRATRRKKSALAIDYFIAACKNLPETDTKEPSYGLMNQSEALQIIKQENDYTLAKLLNQNEPPEISAESLKTLHQQVPITILWGENSRTIFQLSSKTAAKAIEQIGGEIPNVDHLLPEEDVVRFSEIVKHSLLE
ncbi:hypothetical protein DC083_07165 [Ignatzschineria ureiclastica]|uniref:AB hydrolase-1 domain-containing protein n=1 Tax=Ignatzschineria ureiclastica TaxID=472582 RepID=A0A2U2AEA3_9GAMM|nr:alpha/beta hydrolase [Ignatzschineria ureiclastica]PWD80879.1 hypothetical protein DC083_07165 [Ignatzschineria ureiclastica]GGZ94171.1 hypothetical protein GCM10007162_07230 [Ignatzschineria ureiclastica]